MNFAPFRLLGHRCIFANSLSRYCCTKEGRSGLNGCAMKRGEREGREEKLCRKVATSKRRIGRSFQPPSETCELLALSVTCLCLPKYHAYFLFLPAAIADRSSRASSRCLEVSGNVFVCPLDDFVVKSRTNNIGRYCNFKKPDLQKLNFKVILQVKKA